MITKGEDFLLSWDEFANESIFGYLESIHRFSLSIQFPQFTSWVDTKQMSSVQDKLYEEVYELLRHAGLYRFDDLRRVEDHRSVGVEFNETDHEFAIKIDLTNEMTGSARPFGLFVDEAHTFAKGALPDVLAEGRKFGLAAVIANQYLDQFPDKIQKAIAGNVGTVIAFRLGDHDALKLGGRFSPDFLPETLRRLPNFHAACSMLVNGAIEPAFSLYVDHFDQVSTVEAERNSVLVSARPSWRGVRRFLMGRLAIRRHQGCLRNCLAYRRYFDDDFAGDQGSLARVIPQRREERSEIGRAGRCDGMNTPEIQPPVAVHDEVAETGGPAQALGKVIGDDVGLGQLPECVPVRGRTAEAETHARRDREIDHDLHGLPQVQHDRVRRGGQGAKIIGIRRKVFRHPTEVSDHGRRALGQKLPIDPIRHPSAARTSS
jgi:hypothetical protein